MQVRRPLLEHQVEKRIYFSHKASSVARILAKAAPNASNENII
jgi:hypothetical protein